MSARLLLMAPLALAACMPAPPPAQAIASANYGPPVQNAAEIVGAYMVSEFAHDQTPARYVCTTPRRGWGKTAGEFRYGYAVTCHKMLGDVTGAEAFNFIIRDGGVVLYDWSDMGYAE